MRQRAGGFTAIDGLRAERVCADNVQDVRRQRSGNTQTTEVSAKLVSFFARKLIMGVAQGVSTTVTFVSKQSERCVGAQCDVWFILGSSLGTNLRNIQAALFLSLGILHLL